MSDDKTHDKLHGESSGSPHSHLQSRLQKFWQDEVLTFWFEELTPKQWYQSTKRVDDTIRNQFEPLISRIADYTPTSLGNEPRKLLAATIVLDQFPRNSYRGTPKAFAYDPFALEIASHTINEGLDREMSQAERQFCYMPFMHTEDLDTQNQSLALFNKLGTKGGIDAAIEHRDIIVQFGRFPHRNKVLGRQSTPEEIEYLTSAKRFGQ